jgi:chaperonin GroES
MSNALTAKAIGLNPEIVQPLGNYLTVRLYQPEERTPGGILIPEASRDKQVLAEVIAVGQGQRNILDGKYMGCICQPGDLVIVLKHAPVEIKLGGEAFHVVFEGDVIGIVKPQALAAEVATLREQADPTPEAPTETVLEENEQAKATQRASGLIVVESK